MKEAKAFSPGHITGFFQICDQPDDPLLKGSRGAGVSIARGVTTKVQVEKSAESSVKITMNNDATNSAMVSKQVVDSFVSLTRGTYKLSVTHDVEVPIGHGFGSSGAGALSLALALNKVFDLSLPRLDVAQIAHIAEVKCKTGLGTVIAETAGGLEIRVKPGAPSVGQIKSVRVNRDYIVACLSFGPLSTNKILTSKSLRKRINEFGGDLVDELARNPTTRNFMEFSRRFAENVGLISKRLRTVLEETDRAGFTCSTAMLGETAFSIIKQDEVDEVSEIFGKHTSSEGKVIIAGIDFRGARLL